MGRHEWACFAAQQAAEKAVKALHLHLGQEAWGQVVAKLLRELPEDFARRLARETVWVWEAGKPGWVTCAPAAL